MEKQRLQLSLSASLSAAVVSRCSGWPTATLEKQTLTASVTGIKNPSTRAMEAKAGLRGEALRPERMYQGMVETAAKAITIQDLKVHLLLEASPHIIAVSNYQLRALTALSAVLSVRPELLDLPPTIRVEKITSLVAFLANTRQGSYWVDMPPFSKEKDLTSFYQDVLDSTLGLGQYSRTGHIGVTEVDQEMALSGYLDQLADQPEAGVMNMAIIANLTGNSVSFRRALLKSRHRRCGLPTDNEQVVIDLSNREGRGFVPLRIKPKEE